MRVLHVIEASFAGVGRHVIDLVEGLDRLGVENHVLYSSQRAGAAFLDDLATARCATHQTVMSRAPTMRTVAAVHRARTIVHSASIDLVHGHSTGGGTVARLAGAAARVPAVFTPNAFLTLQPELTTIPTIAYRTLERLLRRQTDALICVSPEEHRHAIDLGYAPARTAVIPNGIGSLTTAHPSGTLLGDPAERVIGFVGRLDEQKRPNLLLDAFAHLVHDLGEEKVRLMVVGIGRLADALARQAEALDIAEQVAFLGEQNGQALMGEFDVLAVPSSYEGFPYVVLEALRAGTPVVASEQVPVESFGPAPIGITVVNALDPRAMASGLQSALVGLDRPEAIQATQAPFTIDAMSAATLDVYRSVLGLPGDW